MNNRILIVDDDLAVRHSLRKVLAALGYAVELAADGLEGLCCLQRDPFGLLLLDLDLPKISGWDLLEHVREHAPALPVVVLTAFLDQCEPGALVQADAWLEKPPDVGRLLQTMDRLLQEPAAARSLRLCDRARPLVPPERSYLHLPKFVLGSSRSARPGATT